MSVTITINVSDARSSGNPGDVLVTYSLGSCIGVCLYDPQAKVAGLLHYQLPTSTLDAARAKERPAMFADTGMALLLAQMEALGAQRRRMKVKLAGGAAMLNDASSFNIGKRNHAAIRKILWQLGMFIETEDVGGKSPRTVYLAVADGTLTIKSDGITKVA
jgi:chemotaxis protein CheD